MPASWNGYYLTVIEASSRLTTFSVQSRPKFLAQAYDPKPQCLSSGPTLLTTAAGVAVRLSSQSLTPGPGDS